MSLPYVDLVSDSLPTFLLGDFNLQLAKLADSCSDDRFLVWYEWISNNFINCFPDGQPTFQRQDFRSTIDYVFSNVVGLPRVTACQQRYLPANWTDHQLMCVDLLSNREDVGPGFWRFNPSLLHNESFLDLLDEVTSIYSSEWSQNTVLQSPQKGWEAFKRALRDTCDTFSTGFRKHRQSKIEHLQHQYSDLSSNSLEQPNLANQLSDLLDKEIQMEMQQLLVRSATRWHEQGERNTKYFYKVIRSRETQQTIQAIKSSTTGELVTSTADILKEARRFYQNLYTPERIDNFAVDSLLHNIPADVKVDEQQFKSLDADPSIEELLSVVNHAPPNRSPGLDGIPFEVYKYLFTKFPQVRSLFLQVLVDAYHGTIPISWKQTRMVLLFKKGDPTSLSNWRPLSLINSDAKLFTKILANRFNQVLPSLINPYQTGFLPHRLISDNGWVNLTFMDNYRKSDSPGASSAVAVFLDQEKAYDRVHPDYLSKVLHHFGFPSKLIATLMSLFFGTSISVSVNGYLSASLTQGRGLRQGDPLSPLLFNLAFEPLLRTILASEELPGVSPLPVSRWSSLRADPPVHRNPETGLDDSPIHWNSPPQYKLLSYADDLEVFLSSPSEWSALHNILTLYGSASNAKVNIGKTQLLSLSGDSSPAWTKISQDTGIDYHTKESKNIVRYLGYPLYSNRSQLKKYLQRIKNVMQIKCNQLKQRGLTIRGRSLVINSLVFSKIWHLLRVVPVPDSWLNEIRQLAHSFVADFRPRPSWNQICLDKRYGGLGVINLHEQRMALQNVFLRRILKPKSRVDFVTPLIGYSLYLHTGHHSFLPWLQYPTEYLAFFKNTAPTMHQLTKLITKLPPLLSHHEWSSRWLADTPLKFALFSTLPTEAQQFSISDIPINYIVTDVFSWSYFYHGFTNFLRPGTLRSRAVEIRSLYQQASPPIQWMPLLQRCMPLDYRNVLPPPRNESTVPPNATLRNRWVPSCQHWSVPGATDRKSAMVAQVSPGWLRKYWAQDYLASKNYGPRATQGITVIPFAVFDGYCSPRIWRIFWSLRLPHKVVNCWWRLLKNCISTQAALHARWDARWPSPNCRLCHEAVEDVFHFFVGCPHKWSLWSQAVPFLSLGFLLSTPDDVWAAITGFHTTAGAPIDNSHLELIGCILEIQWRYHWQCVVRNIPWSTQAAMHILMASVGLDLTLKAHMHEVTAEDIDSE
jgi:hypothetical protein